MKIIYSNQIKIIFFIKFIIKFFYTTAFDKAFKLHNREIIRILLLSKKVKYDIEKLLKNPIDILKDVLKYSGFDLMNSDENNNNAKENRN